MASERLQVILELVTGNYKREAREAATATGGISNAAGGVTSSLKSMIGPAAIGGAVVGLVHMAEKAGENADRLFDLEAQTGLSTDALQEWEFVAKTAGANTEVFSDAVKAVIKNLSEAATGTGAASKAYEILGINVLDASGKMRSAGDITDEVFTKLAGMEDITARNALAQDIFGKKWEETISVLDLGTDALASARGEAHELGAVVSGDSLRGADKFREAWAKIKTQLSGKFLEILGNMGPTLTAIAEGFADVLKEAEPLIDGLGNIATGFSEMQEAGEDWSGSTNPLLAGFGEFISEVGIMTLVTGNYTTAANAAADVSDQRLNPSIKDVGEKADEAGKGVKFMADATKDDLVPALSGAVGPIDTYRSAQQRAADSTAAHRDALIGLTSRLIAQLSPASAAYQALKDLRDAQDEAREAVEKFGPKSEEAAAAQLELAESTAEAEAALLRLGGVEGVISALSDTLNISREAARELLVELGLLDGKTFETTHVLNLRTRGDIEALERGVIPEGVGLPTVRPPPNSEATRRAGLERPSLPSGRGREGAFHSQRLRLDCLQQTTDGGAGTAECDRADHRCAVTHEGVLYRSATGHHPCLRRESG